MKVHIDLNPDPPVLHAVQLTALIRHFLSQKARRVQDKTVRGYRFKLMYFMRWWEKEGPKRAWLLDESALFEFASHLVDIRTVWGKPLSWNSRNDVLRRLRQVFRWSHQHNYVSVDFAEFVPTIPGTPAPRMPVTIDTLAALLEACDETNEPVRNRALVAALAGTGIRCEECAALLVENVRLHQDGSGYLRLSVAKFDNLRIVGFDAATGSHLRLWMDRLHYDAGPLFPSRKGRNRNPKPLSASGLYKMLVRIAEIADAREQIQGAHDLRRMFATTWARVQPGTVPLLQKQLGHKSSQTTMMYVLNSVEDVHEAMRNAPVSPMAQLALLNDVCSVNQH